MQSELGKGTTVVVDCLLAQKARAKT